MRHWSDVVALQRGRPLFVQRLRPRTRAEHYRACTETQLADARTCTDTLGTGTHQLLASLHGDGPIL